MITIVITIVYRISHGLAAHVKAPPPCANAMEQHLIKKHCRLSILAKQYMIAQTYLYIYTYIYIFM